MKAELKDPASLREEGFSLEAAVKREAGILSKKEEYSSIPRLMRKVAIDAALKALLTPRNKLYEALEAMEKAASPKNAGKTLKTSRDTAKRFMRNWHFSENQRSRFLTKLDRELIAAATVQEVLAESTHSAETRNATLWLSRDLVSATHKYLPKSEQWDKNARTILPEEMILFTANLIPQSVEWELHRPPRRKKKSKKKR